ncbi:MAG TPA: polyketide synthase, partial [Solirubrobacteraceae bacterium]|nr:polyketide synthase [Solirubrobacteraceae bacterium]
MPDGSSIAIIGLSCRVPRAPSAAEFWHLLSSGRDAIEEMPEQRHALQSGRSIVRSVATPESKPIGGWVEGIELFDAPFFGISPREAAAIDPQQRLMLELCWEAFEDAHVVPAGLVGSQTGVFVGAIANDYGDLAHEYGHELITRHAVTGLRRGMIANRVSYT